MTNFTIDIAALQHQWRAELPPLFVVELDRVGAGGQQLFLPPCPVIGIGDSAHPLAERLDCVIESPTSVEGIIDQIVARPAAAAIFVQLLRLIDGMPLAQALIAESLAFATLQGGAEHREWLKGRSSLLRTAPGQLHVSREGNVLRLVIDRPHAANAIDVSMREMLREALDLAVLDGDIELVEIRGSGRVFGVGADLAEFGTTHDSALAHQIRMQTLPALAAIHCGNRMISRVQGLCVGSSLELAAFGRIEATKDTVFQLPELKMGIIPGAGGCVALANKIGRQRTALMVLSGRRIRAKTALNWGLADRIVD